ncbi:MAG: phosphatidylserine/phosphatidylglycerophosphate/cardiolipin synthase family protein [bacterium]
MDNTFSYQFYSSTITAWQAMYQAVLGAYKSVYWEIYTFIDDEAGNRFIDLLCDKATQGVDVKIIIDAVGSYSLSQLAICRLKNAGVEVLVFNKLSLDFSLKKWWSRIWLRTHCKILIIDEEIAFVGGVNVQHHTEEWDDLHLRLTGRVTRPLSRYFAKKYIRCGGRRKNVRHLMHPKLTKGIGEFRDRIRFIMHSPLHSYQRSPFRGFYRHALSIAKQSFTLLTPYYSPDPKFLELIYRARKRGAKVNIIMPYKSDLRLMQYMARAFYGISKKAGATFYFLNRMNHGKAISVDNKIGMVGSSNFTPRSSFINHEANVAFTDQDMVDELNDILSGWQSQADPLLELDFKRQGWFKRFKSWWASQLKDYV